MSIRLEKKNHKRNQALKLNDMQINTAFTIYDSELDSLYRKLGRKTDSIDWVEQAFPYIAFSGISNVESGSEWMLPSDNARNKSLEIQPNGDLSIDISLVEGDSFYLQTGSMDINRPPLDKDAWSICEGYKYQVLLNAQYGEQRPDCAAFIIQYDADKRVAHKFQQVYHGLNKIEFEAVAGANYICIALRFKGEGTLKVKPIKVLAEEMLPVRAIELESYKNEGLMPRAFELKAKVLTSAFEKRILSLPDSPKVQATDFEDLKNKLAAALYEKKKVEKSLEYRLGKTIAATKISKLTSILTLPKKLIKIRAASRKGRFEIPQLNLGLKQELLESVGVFNESRPDEEITWPSFEPQMNLRNQHINIVSISDKFTYECFRYEANFIQLTKKNWKAEIDDANPVMFFVESAWNGNDGEWSYTMASYKKHLGDPLREAIKYCKSKGIPVVFWNKEDPTNYDVFINVAADCDHIFTTDGAIIEKYKARVGHDRVYSLAFAAQPAIHNPIRDKRKQLPEYEVCFAGSWYNNGHDTRKVQTEIVLDGATNYELHIYDRMLHAKEHRESRIFPAKFQPFISGSLNYDQMVTAYRQYKVFLNINTVQDSPTMFSRRVFEILACATPIVSTASLGMDNMLEGHVFSVENKDETNSHLSKLLGNDLYRQTAGHKASRHVLSNHTYQNRLGYIFDSVGVSGLAGKYLPLVSVIMCTNRPENIGFMIDNFSRQNYKNKELIVVINKDGVDLSELENKLSVVSDFQIIHVKEKESLGQCLNEGVRISSGEVIAKLDDDDYYGDFYLFDSVQALDFSGADVVGKDSHFAYVESKDELILIRSGKDNRYSDFVIGASLVIKRDVLNKISFHDRSRGEDSQFLLDCKENGFTVYSSDSFNYITVRRKDLSSHTWKIEDDDFMKKSKFISKSFDKSLVGI